MKVDKGRDSRVRNTSFMLLTAVSITAATLLVFRAVAQEAPRDPSAQASTGAQQEPGQQGEDSSMRMQCPMMAGLEGIDLFADSPAVLLAQTKELKLSNQQAEQLKTIQESSRRQARELLTNEQREQLPADSSRPLSMMELCMMRMPMKGEPPKEMCPMCMKMMMHMKEGKGRGQAAKQE